MRRNSVLTYLHADHPSASLLRLRSVQVRTSLGLPVLTTASGVNMALRGKPANFQIVGSRVILLV
jgi:hypothetical protein